jgi:hypothetical protein
MSASAYRAGKRAGAAPSRRAKAAPPRRRPAASRGRYRVAPRGRGRRRGASRIDWERAGRIALVLVLFLIVALYVNPLAGFVNAWQESKAEQESLAQVERTNAELEKRLAVLSQPGGTEREARKLGMVAADERSYVVRGLRDK